MGRKYYSRSRGNYIVRVNQGAGMKGVVYSERIHENWS